MEAEKGGNPPVQLKIFLTTRTPFENMLWDWLRTERRRENILK